MRLAPIKNLKPPFTDPRYEMISPKVLRYGDVAVLTFNLVNYRKLSTGEESVVARWNSTEVYSSSDGKWRIIHSHWSYIKPQLKTSGPIVRMSSELIALHFKTREEWRAWLARHHASSIGIWFVFYKRHTGQKSISYEDMVQEALCFGWIDSLIKRIDDNRYAIKVTPRQPTSKWSNLNRKRWADLKAVGLLTQAGLAAAPTNKSYAAKPVIPDLPSYIAKAFRKNTKAWEFFQELAPTHRRYFVVWIHTAKRPETREKRIRESIRLLAARKKLGLK